MLRSTKLWIAVPANEKSALDERYDRLTCSLATKDWEATTSRIKPVRSPFPDTNSAAATIDRERQNEIRSDCKYGEVGP
jgi:hypothetical protein